MTDEAPEEIQDTPDEAAPEGTPAPESEDSTTAVDWEKRYNDLRPEWDRTTQRLSEYERFIDSLTNEDTQAQALQALGLTLEDEYEYEEPDPQDRLARVEQYLAGQEEARAQAQLAELERQYFDQELREIEKRESVSLSDEEQRTIAALAHSLRDSDGVPDVKAAYQHLTSAADAKHKRYLSSKRAPQLEVGTAGQEKVDLSSPEARANLIAQYAQAEME